MTEHFSTFVTGSTGLLGSNLVRLLADEGHRVKVLARSAEKARRLFRGIQLDVIEGDLGDVGGFASALEEGDVIFHAAAYFREYYQPGNHWKTLEEINVRGTVALLHEAARRGARKVVYISSSGVIGRKPDGAPGDEQTPPHPVARKNLYFFSKVRAEEAVQDFLTQHRLPVTLILPGWMFGPSDSAPTGSGQLVLDFMNKKLPGIPSGGASVVDARDVAQAAINAVAHGQSGERYIVGGSYFSLGQVLHTLSEVTGLAMPKRHIPYLAAMAFGWASERMSRITGKPALVSRDGLRTMHAELAVNSAKAVRELGATFRPLAETLRDEVEWFLSQGLVEKPSPLGV
jgi:dihydroflavonol-4-reductase